MIVIDASVVIAVILKEPGHEGVVGRMLADPERKISPMSLVEATMVLSKLYSDPNVIVEGYLLNANIAVVPVDLKQSQWAIHAFLMYGKGRHPARLNLGDCFSYAAAKALNAPLLYVGGDFAKTDVRAA